MSVTLPNGIMSTSRRNRPCTSIRRLSVTTKRSDHQLTISQPRYQTAADHTSQTTSRAPAARLGSAISSSTARKRPPPAADSGTISASQCRHSAATTVSPGSRYLAISWDPAGNVAPRTGSATLASMLTSRDRSASEPVDELEEAVRHASGAVGELTPALGYGIGGLGRLMGHGVDRERHGRHRHHALHRGPPCCPSERRGPYRCPHGTD